MRLRFYGSGPARQDSGFANASASDSGQPRASRILALHTSSSCGKESRSTHRHTTPNVWSTDSDGHGERTKPTIEHLVVGVLDGTRSELVQPEAMLGRPQRAESGEVSRSPLARERSPASWPRPRPTARDRSLRDPRSARRNSGRSGRLPTPALRVRPQPHRGSSGRAEYG